jgi:hypothetical protein
MMVLPAPQQQAEPFHLKSVFQPADAAALRGIKVQEFAL